MIHAWKLALAVYIHDISVLEGFAWRDGADRLVGLGSMARRFFSGRSE